MAGFVARYKLRGHEHVPVQSGRFQVTFTLSSDTEPGGKTGRQPGWYRGKR